MKYWLESDTLIIEGPFNALSSGLLGGWKDVEHIFNHTVVEHFDRLDPVEYLKGVAERFEMKSYFGLLTSVPIDKLSVVKSGEVTAFVTAGVKNPNQEVKADRIGTINIILIVDADLSDGGMINAVITATEAKSAALFELGHNFTGTSTDAVVVARTGGKYYEYAGPASELGSRIWYAVKKGVKESLSRW
jgi:adenosylcobinamide hydrolase